MYDETYHCGCREWDEDVYKNEDIMRYCSGCREPIRTICNFKLNEPEKIIDEVTNPAHYQGKGMTVIDVIRAFNLSFELASAVKYILRCENKGNKLKDLKKAIRSIELEIERPTP